ncbi:CLUMA_CG012167, isoform A [Clunio marinus]|uniref:CLUMA_CG012167, isoform A n=1 Tax=Clunio marinus TaxID=568069 RepID=A0A1J1IIM4_9DIPT|nr:CLUMA_CG012167, isoform A [Clunio marinus]
MGEIVNNIVLLIILTLGSTTFATRQCAAGPQFCTRNGINYQPGDSVPSLDSCNTCWCNGNVSPPAIVCTKIGCPS